MDEDIWDDTALIKAYDKAVNLAKEEVARRIAMDTQSEETKQKAETSKKLNSDNSITVYIIDFNLILIQCIFLRSLFTYVIL